MELRRDALFGTIALFSMMALVSFGTIGLIARMQPEIHRILDENVTSSAAAERMLVVLAGSGGAPLEPSEREDYDEALAVLAANVTERGEGPLVASLEQRRDGTVGTDVVARLVSIDDLDRILDINRKAISVADERAQQLGVAGAWAVVLMTLVAMYISYVAVRRLDRRLLAPVIHLHRVLEQAAEGEQHRRCHERGGARELDEIYEVVNDLLDHRVKTMEVRADAAGAAIHAALVRVLDERSEPSFVVYENGELLAINKLGLEVLAGENGETLRDSLRAIARGVLEEPALIAGRELRVDRIEGASASLCSLLPSPPEPASAPETAGLG